MKRLFSRRPSAAMIVAMVALVAALAGTAIAGAPFLKTTQFKKFKSNAVTRLTYVNQTRTFGDTGSGFSTVTADCPGGFHPVGGGVKLSPDNQNIWWDDGHLTPTGYASKIVNTSGSNATALVTVACVAARAAGSPSG